MEGKKLDQLLGMIRYKGEEFLLQLVDAGLTRTDTEGRRSWTRVRSKRESLSTIMHPILLFKWNPVKYNWVKRVWVDKIFSK